MGVRSWPPTLADVKTDKGITTSSDDTELQQTLDAAIAYVQRVRGEDINFAADPVSDLPLPDDDMWLGLVRQCGRWHDRRRSADGLIVTQDAGTTRVPAFDADIERMLGMGRYRGPVFG